MGNQNISSRERMLEHKINNIKKRFNVSTNHTVQVLMVKYLDRERDTVQIMIASKYLQKVLVNKINH